MQLKERLKSAIKLRAVKLGYSSKPDFMIIGAQKAGTSALFSMLDQCNNITPSKIKEIHYFDKDQKYKNSNLAEYHLHFPLPFRVPKDNLIFEATPSYLYYPEVAERLFNYNPNLKFVVLLRDPAYRALSAWTMYHHHFKTGIYQHLHDPRSFEEAINEELQDFEIEIERDAPYAYVKRGIYFYQIENYYNYFSKESFIFIENTDLLINTQTAMKKLFDFLGIEKQKIELVRKNKSKVDNKLEYMDEIIRLKNFYKPYNQRLYHLLSDKFNWD